LTACNSGNQSSNTSSTNPSTLSSSSLIIGNIATIPASPAESHNSTTLTLSNNAKQTLQFTGINIESNGVSIPQSQINNLIDTSNCKQLHANTQCQLKLFDVADLQNGYVLQLQYLAASGELISATQLISFSENLPDNNGIIISNGNMTTTDNVTLSVPFLLTQEFNKINANLDGESQIPVNCPNGLHKGSLCTALVNTVSQPDAAQLTINGYNENSIITTTINQPITITNTSSANLVTSAINPTISPADSKHSVTVTLANSGTSAATNLKIYANTPVTVETNTDTPCGDTLNANSLCSFKFNTTTSVATSGQSTALITYTTSTGTQTIPINVSYISTTPSPMLTMTSSGSFTNLPLKQKPSYMTVTVKNTGNVAFQNLNFNDLSNANSYMTSYATGSTCIPKQALAIGYSCDIVLSYTPTIIESGNVTLVATANYSSQDGGSLTYSNSSLTIPYSTSNSPSFTAVGDFGVVVTSTHSESSPTPLQWTPTVMDPYNPLNESFPLFNDPTSLNYVNGRYVVTMYMGEIKYSSLNGLFWQTQNSQSTDIFRPQCPVIYDGKYYYTCATLNYSLGNCQSGTGGCIMRTDNIESGTWTGITMALNYGGYNFTNLGYFSYNGKAAYVATTDSFSSTAGLITSVDGVNWVATPSGQTSQQYPTFLVTVLNTSNGILTAWDNSGHSSSQNISSVSSTWTPSSIAIPEASQVTDAVYQNNNYVITLANGSIYTTPNPATTTYTKRSSNSTKLNKLVYANNINNGTFFALGDTGINLTATDPNSTWTSNPTLLDQYGYELTTEGACFDGSSVWVTNYEDILKTNDGKTWFTPALQSITKNGNSYLAVDNQGYIYYSTDLTKWSQQNNPTKNVLNSIYCAEPNTCFAVGNNGTILKSTDGKTWEQLDSKTAANLNSMVCKDGYCLIVGGSGSTNSGTVLNSNNYTSWTASSTTLATSNLKGIAFYNKNNTNIYIAVGDNGSIFTSVDGSNWSLGSSTINKNLNAVSCGNTGCVAVGNQATILYSLDANSWSVVSAPTAVSQYDLLSITYNKIFVIGGSGNVLLYSSIPDDNLYFKVSMSTFSWNYNAVISR
ncbi:MAG: trimeric autotransporter adhesin, partial [Pseudomonadota bacterium]|nr:trimeric autotransporter adhesin [Pseudomonadota bacterium]